MGADSFLAADDVRMLDTQGKLWLDGERVVGASGNLHVINLLRHGFAFPEQKEGVSDEAYMRFTFPAAFRAFLKEHAPEGERVDIGALIGWRGRLWQLDSDFCVCEAPHFDAIGSGGEVARAALDVALRFPGAPLKQLGLALETAARYVVPVSGPFEFLAEPAP